MAQVKKTVGDDPVKTADYLLARLREESNTVNAKGMQRFGIRYKEAYGIKIPVLRALAKTIGKNDALSLELWSRPVHEAKLLAIFIADAAIFDKKRMNAWVKEFDSWDICDQACINIFCKTPYAYEQATRWCSRSSEFEKRAGFALMAVLSVHDKKAADGKFEVFLEEIEKEADDDRNFVKKAVNWALRAIGKRNERLKIKAMQTAEKIKKKNSPAARWIASDALRELARK